MPHKISRRTFLKTGAAVAATSVLAGCEQYRRYVTLEPYVRPPEEQVTGVATWYASACRMCDSGCGIIVRIMNGRALKIEGNPEHPLNRGKLCPRGQAGVQLLYNPDRLPGPVTQAKRGSGFQGAMPWAEALDLLTRQIQGAGGKVAIWLGPNTSGHLYDLFSRFATAIGAPAPLFFGNGLDGSQEMAAANNRLFGRNVLAGHDLSHADVVLSFGGDPLGVGPSATRYGIEYGAFRTQPLGLRGYLVQFEPRQSNTGAKADDWFPIPPGTEGLIAQAIARLIADQKLGPDDRVGRAGGLAGNVNVNDVVKLTGIRLEDLTRVARIFGNAQHPVVIAGSDVARQANGGDALAAVQALNVLAGTAGQPGGLRLAADSPSPAVVRPTPSTFADIQGLLDKMRGGGVQVLLLYGVNPAYELPDKAGFGDALNKVGFLVTFSPVLDETSALANLVLPERTYLESWGYSVVANNFGTPIVTGQQPVVQPVFDVRSPADVLLTIAKNIPAAAGALHWSDEVAFLREQVAQLGPGAAGGEGPDVLWARFQQHGGWWPANPPAPAALTPTTTAAPALSPPQYQGAPDQFPYYLHVFESPLLGNGSGANLPWLQGSPDPMTTIAWQTWVEIHPDTAKKLGVTYGDIVRVTSPNGEIEAPVYVYPVIRPDTIGIPLGQGHSSFGRYAQNRGANAMRLLGPTPDTWTTTRVAVARTGNKVNLAVFEYTPGVNEGFPNAAFPGTDQFGGQQGGGTGAGSSGGSGGA